MRLRRFAALVLVLSLGLTSDLFACGDKFLIGGRGTRYQRPKNARAAQVLIYADPASAAAIKKANLEKLLKVEGHKATKVATLGELSTIMSSGRYDVILSADSTSADVRKTIAAGPDAAIVVGIDDLMKNRTLLQAIDKAVLQRDQNLKKPAARSS